jgi:hypothetical protein
MKGETRAEGTTQAGGFVSRKIKQFCRLIFAGRWLWGI